MEDDIILDLDKLRQQTQNALETYGVIGTDGFGTTTSGLAAVRNAERLWPSATVPFLIESDVPNQTRITEAIAHWESVTPLRFVPRQNENDFVAFVRHDDRCASDIGRDGGRQEILLADTCSSGSMKHEIGHAIGLFHEQSREDRDHHVIIHWDNIQSGKGHNFNKYSDPVFLWFGASDGQDVGPYDFQSIMHYGSFFFADDTSKPTVTRRHGCSGSGCEIAANRSALSTNDTRYVHELYCPMLNWNPTRCANYLEPADGPAYWLVVQSSDKCLDVANGSMSAQAGVNEFTCHMGNNQLWQLQPDPDGSSAFYIRAKHSGQCLDVPGSSTGFVLLQQYACHGGDNQKFRPFYNTGPFDDYNSRRHGEFFLKPVHSNKCLGVDWQGHLKQTDCTSSDVELFQFEVREFPFDVYDVMAKDSGECLDVPSSQLGTVQVQDYPCHGGENQAWKFLPRANGAFALQAEHSDKCLGVSGANVIQTDCGTPDTPAATTSFWLHLMSDGTHELRSGFPRKCSGVGSGTYLAAGSCDWTDELRFFFLPR
jgi:hypothetical protein